MIDLLINFERSFFSSGLLLRPSGLVLSMLLILQLTSTARTTSLSEYSEDDVIMGINYQISFTTSLKLGLKLSFNWAVEVYYHFTICTNPGIINCIAAWFNLSKIVTI